MRRLALLLLLGLAPFARAEAPPLTQELAGQLAAVAMACIDREFPGKPELYLDGPKDVRSPRAIHPIFFGCYDWHSAVHGHYMLLRLLRLYPTLAGAQDIRAHLDARFTAANFAAEADYLSRPSRRAFERPYGWAWALRLFQELRSVPPTDSAGQRWTAAAAPLEAIIVQRLRDYLPLLSHPVRTGTHANSAFALGMALDYARARDDDALRDLIIERSLRYYGKDRQAPIAYEPAGEDFLSPTLCEADLMRRVLPQDQFARWLDGFLPSLGGEAVRRWLQPVTVTDPGDGRLAHLDGLNISRAFMLRGLASALPKADPRVAVLQRLADQHAEAGLSKVFSGRYEGEHWLASFAVYERTRAGLK